MNSWDRLCDRRRYGVPAAVAGIAITAFLSISFGFHQRIERFVRISAQIEYDGKSYAFEHWFECVRDKQSGQWRRWPYSREIVRFRFAKRLFAARLSTGEGFLFIAPYDICGIVRIPSQNHEGARTEPEFGWDFSRFVPVILIADDADDPSFLEAHISNAVVTDPSSKLRLLSFSAHYSTQPHAELSDPSEVLPWLKQEKGERYWYSHRLLLFGETIWRDSPKLAAHLDKIQKSKSLVEEEQYAALNYLPRGAFLSILRLEAVRGMLIESRCDTPKTYETQYCREQRAKRFVPLLRSGERPNRMMVQDHRSPVKLTYYPSDVPTDCIDQIHGWAVACIEVRPNHVIPFGWGDRFFDAETKELIKQDYHRIKFDEFM